MTAREAAKALYCTLPGGRDPRRHSQTSPFISPLLHIFVVSESYQNMLMLIFSCTSPGRSIVSQSRMMSDSDQGVPPRSLSQTSSQCRLCRSVDLVLMAAKGSTKPCVWCSLFPFTSYQSPYNSCFVGIEFVDLRCYLATCRDPKQPGKTSPPLVTLPCPRREAI